jgi:U3 small nucleolar RNA-associated protein 14
MAEYDIEGLENAETVEKFPEGIGSRTRTTAYDALLTDAKKEVKKLVFRDEKRAKNVVLALKQKLKSKTYKPFAETLMIARAGSEVYIGPKAKIPK